MVSILKTPGLFGLYDWYCSTCCWRLLLPMIAADVGVVAAVAVAIDIGVVADIVAGGVFDSTCCCAKLFPAVATGMNIVVAAVGM